MIDERHSSFLGFRRLVTGLFGVALTWAAFQGGVQAHALPHHRIAHPHPARMVTPAIKLPPPPPWPRPADTQARVFAAGLHFGRMEGSALHIHQHLDVFYQGRRVTVPAGIGLIPGYFSEMHTHASFGTIHIESPVVRSFTLGQFFREWGVPLTGAKVYVNGHSVSRPASLILRDKQEIAVIFGRSPAVIPKIYPGYHL